MSIVTKGTNRKTGGLLRRHDSRFVVVPIVNPSYSSVENRIDYSIQAVLGQTVLHFDTKGIDLHRYQQNLLEDSSEAARIEEVSDGEVVTSGGRRYIEPPSRLSPEATPQQVQHHEQGLSPRVLTSAHMPQIHNARPRADSPTASPAVNRAGGNFSLQQSNAFRPQGRDRRLSPTTQQVSAKPENHYAHGDPPTNNPVRHA